MDQEHWSNEEDSMLLKLRNTDGLDFVAMEEFLKAPASLLRKRWTQLMSEHLRAQPKVEWTENEEAALIKLYQGGMTDHDELAAEIGRTRRAIEARIQRLRDSLPNRKKRTPVPPPTYVDDDTATTEDEVNSVMSDAISEVSKPKAKRQPTTTTTTQETAKLTLPLTMDVYDKMIGEPYYERRLRLIEYREWLTTLPKWFITNHYIEKEQVEREVGKCNDLIRLLE